MPDSIESDIEQAVHEAFLNVNPGFVNSVVNALLAGVPRNEICAITRKATKNSSDFVYFETEINYLAEHQ